MKTDSSSNFTDILNMTEDFDHFCNELTTGPLIMSIVSGPCVCVGLPVSAWLFWVLIQRQRNSMSNDVYMLNLTTMDLIYNTFKIPCLLNYFFWKDHKFLSLTIFLEGFSLNGRPLIMACMCVDCYMAVIFPILYLKVKQTRYRLVACTVVWFGTFVYHIMFALWTELFNQPVGGTPRILAVFIIAFCCINILHTLRRPDPSGRSDVHPQKQRALQIITNSFIMTVVSYLLPLVLYVVSPLLPFNSQERFCNVFVSTLFCNTLGSTIMPLLYLGNLGRLKGIRMCQCA